MGSNCTKSVKHISVTTYPRITNVCDNAYNTTVDKILDACLITDVDEENPPTNNKVNSMMVNKKKPKTLETTTVGANISSKSIAKKHKHISITCEESASCDHIAGYGDNEDIPYRMDADDYIVFD